MGARGDTRLWKGMRARQQGMREIRVTSEDLIGAKLRAQRDKILSPEKFMSSWKLGM